MNAALPTLAVSSLTITMTDTISIPTSALLPSIRAIAFAMIINVDSVTVLFTRSTLIRTGAICKRYYNCHGCDHEYGYDYYSTPSTMTMAITVTTNIADAMTTIVTHTVIRIATIAIVITVTIQSC